MGSEAIFAIPVSWEPAAVFLIVALTYAGIAMGQSSLFRLDRTGYALLGATFLMATGCITLQEAVSSVNWQSILLLFSLMVVAAQLHYSGIYDRLTKAVVRFLDRPVVFLGILMLVSGVASAFLNNDVVCLAFTPVLVVALQERRLNPVPFLVALAISSNTGCAFTLIGNAQNVLVGEVARLDFGAYISYAALPVFLCLLAAYLIIAQQAKGKWAAEESEAAERCRECAELLEPMPLNPWRATKGLGILLLIVGFFLFSDVPQYIVALTGGGLLLCSRRLESRKVLAMVNWQLLLLFMGLFVVVGAFDRSGGAEQVKIFLAHFGVDLSNRTSLIVVTSLLSNLINNSAAVMLLLKIGDFTNQQNGYALAMANAVAGNLLLIGSLANVIVAQTAEIFGVKVTFRTFAWYGVPVTIVSVGILCAWTWLV